MLWVVGRFSGKAGMARPRSVTGDELRWRYRSKCEKKRGDDLGFKGEATRASSRTGRFGRISARPKNSKGLGEYE